MRQFNTRLYVSGWRKVVPVKTAPAPTLAFFSDEFKLEQKLRKNKSLDLNDEHRFSLQKTADIFPGTVLYAIYVSKRQSGNEL